MQVLVSDTNVIIDFEVGGLIETLTGAFTLAVPDVLWEQELKQRRSAVATC